MLVLVQTEEGLFTFGDVNNYVTCLRLDLWFEMNKLKEVKN